jgi:hypothetical protein
MDIWMRNHGDEPSSSKWVAWTLDFIIGRTEWCCARERGWMMCTSPSDSHRVCSNYKPGQCYLLHTRNRFLLLSKHKAPSWLDHGLGTNSKDIGQLSVGPSGKRCATISSLCGRELEFLGHRWDAGCRITRWMSVRICTF